MTDDDLISELIVLVEKSARPTNAIMRQAQVCQDALYDWKWRRHKPSLMKFVRVLDAIGYELKIHRKT